MKRIIVALIRKLAKRYGLVVITQQTYDRQNQAVQRLEVATNFLIRVDNGHPVEASWNKGSLASFLRTLQKDSYGRMFG